MAYLGTVVFSELLRMSEEFGFTGDGGRITLPCDAAVVEYVMYCSAEIVDHRSSLQFVAPEHMQGLQLLV